MRADATFAPAESLYHGGGFATGTAAQDAYKVTEKLNPHFHSSRKMPEDLPPHDDPDEANDDEPTPEELAQMRRATPADAAAVDSLILQSCTNRWRKVAQIVGASLNEFDARFPHLPYVYMPIRIMAMEQDGALEVQGDAMAMRFSEVRLAAKQS